MTRWWLILCLIVVAAVADQCQDYCRGHIDCSIGACGDLLCACNGRGELINGTDCLCDERFSGLDCKAAIVADEVCAANAPQPISMYQETPWLSCECRPGFSMLLNEDPTWNFGPIDGRQCKSPDFGAISPVHINTTWTLVRAGGFNHQLFATAGWPGTFMTFRSVAFNIYSIHLSAMPWWTLQYDLSWSGREVEAPALFRVLCNPASPQECTIQSLHNQQYLTISSGTFTYQPSASWWRLIFAGHASDPSAPGVVGGNPIAQIGLVPTFMACATFCFRSSDCILFTWQSNTFDCVLHDATASALPGPNVYVGEKGNFCSGICGSAVRYTNVTLGWRVCPSNSSYICADTTNGQRLDTLFTIHATDASAANEAEILVGNDRRLIVDPITRFARVVHHARVSDSIQTFFVTQPLGGSPPTDPTGFLWVDQTTFDSYALELVNGYLMLVADSTATFNFSVPGVCKTIPCQSGGTCTDHATYDDYSCACVPGRTGKSCETDINECASNPCFDGDCVDAVNGYTCQCYPGFSGTHCETNIDECASNPCQNGGTCGDSTASYYCTCPETASYCGPSCNIDACTTILPGGCQNGGTCSYNWAAVIIGNPDPNLNGCPNPSCLCPPGYSGYLCQTNINECASLPCQNGGTCSDTVDGYNCVCAQGFSGIHCQTDINECASTPCQNGGTCADGVNGYVCTCSSGYSGVACQTDIDECDSGPCLNEGVCVDQPDGYTCTCLPGYSGILCQTNINECASTPCQNSGSCTDTVDGFTCSCASGYSGVLCQTNINECASVPCANGGTCVDDIDSFTCTCADGFTSVFCTVNIDECQSMPCNNGTCVDGVASYVCNCYAGYSGTRCETNINECASMPCQNGATCVDKTNNYECNCVAGFTGYTCEQEMVECASDPCQNGGMCMEGINSFLCICDDGFSGDLCQTNIDYCASDPCENGGTCVDLVEGVRCDCPDGWAGSFCESVSCVISNPQHSQVTPSGFSAPIDPPYQLNLTEWTLPLEQTICMWVAPTHGGMSTFGNVKQSCKIVETDGYGPKVEMRSEANSDLHVDCWLGDKLTSLTILRSSVEYAAQRNWTFICCGYSYDSSTHTVHSHAYARTPTDTTLRHSSVDHVISQTTLNVTTIVIGADLVTVDPFEVGPDNYTDVVFTGAIRHYLSSNRLLTQAEVFALGMVGQVPRGPYRRYVPFTGNGPHYDLITGTALTPRSIENAPAVLACDVDPTPVVKFYNDTFECDSQPCFNGATCNEGVQSFTCTCAPGYSGLFCQTNIDECSSAPCKHGGICSDLVNGYSCACPQDFTGTDCSLFSIVLVDPTQAVSDAVLGSTNRAAVLFNSTTQLELDNFVFSCDVLWNKSSPGQMSFAWNLHTGSFPNAMNHNLVSFAISLVRSVTIYGGIGITNGRLRFGEFGAEQFIFPTPVAHLSDSSPTEWFRFGVAAFRQSWSVDDLYNWNVTVVVHNVTVSALLEGPIRWPTLHQFAWGSLTNSAPTRAAVRDFKLKYNATSYDEMHALMTNGTIPLSGLSAYVPWDEGGVYAPRQYGPYATNNTLFASSALAFRPGWTTIASPVPPVHEFCSRLPCRNGGTCQQTLYHFNCSCAVGYTDGLCSTNINDCVSNPCQNGATCNDGIESYTCSCAYGYHGPLCQFRDRCDAYYMSVPDGSNTYAATTVAAAGAADVWVSFWHKSEGNSDIFRIAAASSNPVMTVYWSSADVLALARVGDVGSVSSASLWRAGWHHVVWQMSSTGMSLVHRDTSIVIPSTMFNTGVGLDGLASVTMYSSFDDLFIFYGSLPSNGDIADLYSGVLVPTAPQLTFGYTFTGNDVSSSTTSANPSAAPFDVSGSSTTVSCGPCFDTPCFEGGICANTGQYSMQCTCPPGFSGARCETDIDECASNPCKNGGICTDQTNNYICTCPLDFTGTDCSLVSVALIDPNQIAGHASIGAFNRAAILFNSTRRLEVENFAFACDVLWNKTASGQFTFAWNLVFNGFPAAFTGTQGSFSVIFNRNPSVYGGISLGASRMRFDTATPETFVVSEPLAELNGSSASEWTRIGVAAFRQSYISGSAYSWNITLWVHNQTTSYAVTGTSLWPTNHQFGWGTMTSTPTTRHAVRDFKLRYNATSYDEMMALMVNGTIPLGGLSSYVPADEGGIDPPRQYGPYATNNSFYATSGLAFRPGWKTISSPLPPQREFCSRSPCRNGGTCSQTLYHFNCSCLSGFTDGLCSTNIDDCVSNPCQNGAVCNDGVNSYTCSCAYGYYGTLCEYRDHCDAYYMSVANGSSTSSTIGYSTGGMESNTIAGWFNSDGNNDIFSIGSSAGDPTFHVRWATFNTLSVSNHLGASVSSTAMLRSGWHFLVFALSWTGSFALYRDGVSVIGPHMFEPEGLQGVGTVTVSTSFDDFMVLINYMANPSDANSLYLGNYNVGLGSATTSYYYPFTSGVLTSFGSASGAAFGTGAGVMVATCGACLSTSCQNGGTCTNTGFSTASCTCPAGYSGALCQTEINECSSAPCQNGGTCTDQVNAFSCNCVAGYSGASCQTNVNECASAPCHNGGTCTDNLDGYQCACMDGFGGSICNTDTLACPCTRCYGDYVRSTSLSNSFGVTFFDDETYGGGFPAINTNVTIFFRTRFVNGEAAAEKPFWQLQGVNAPVAFMAQFAINSSQLSLQYNDGTYSPQLCTVSVANLTNQWVSFALVISPAGFKVYYHTRLVGESCTFGDPANIMDIPFFQAYMDVDDFYVYNRSLSAHEIYRLAIDNVTTTDRPAVYIPFTGGSYDNQGELAWRIHTTQGGNAGYASCGTCAEFSTSCQNGGTCTDDLDSFTCGCAGGFSGIFCQTNINECASNPCQNTGTCVDGNNGFTCTCAPGYSGVFCQTNINECASVPCQNGGTCTNNLNAFSCSCVAGYSGTHCQTNINECASAPCQNGGTCTDGLDGYTCACLPGHLGTWCQTNVNECASNPCQNGGSCVDGTDSFICRCTGIYYGTLCTNAMQCVRLFPNIPSSMQYVTGGSLTTQRSGFRTEFYSTSPSAEYSPLSAGASFTVDAVALGTWINMGNLGLEDNGKWNINLSALVIMAMLGSAHTTAELPMALAIQKGTSAGGTSFTMNLYCTGRSASAQSYALFTSFVYDLAVARWEYVSCAVRQTNVRIYTTATNTTSSQTRTGVTNLAPGVDAYVIGLTTGTSTPVGGDPFFGQIRAPRGTYQYGGYNQSVSDAILYGWTDTYHSASSQLVGVGFSTPLNGTDWQDYGLCDTGSPCVRPTVPIQTSAPNTAVYENCLSDPSPTCPPDYSGPECDQANACASSPCSAGQRCIKLNNAYSCV